MRALLPLHLHVAEVLVDGFADGRLRADSGSGSGAATTPSRMARSSTALRRAWSTSSSRTAVSRRLAAFAPLDEVAPVGQRTPVALAVRLSGDRFQDPTITGFELFE